MRLPASLLAPRFVLPALLATAILIASAATAHAQDEDEDEEPTPWDQGRIALTLVLSTQESFGDSYFVVGAGGGYYVLPGLELGVVGVRWFGGDPGVTEVSPQVRYVVTPLGWPLLPYVGAFYTHFFIEGELADADTIGGRVGLLYHQGSGLIVGVGAAFERFVSECSDDCSTIYPEVSVGFTF
jgi:hypothetical protein